MKKLSIIIPAKNEAKNLHTCIPEISEILILHNIDHEILVIDDGSTDNTSEIINNITNDFGSVICIKNKNDNGFGRAIRLGLEHFSGDAVAIMMADRSDSPHDLIKYWKVLNDGTDCAFGSRFLKGSKVYDYPKIKLVINRIVNLMIRFVFKVNYNDVTNAFKMYKKEVIEGCKPFIAPHFNLTVEIPLKAIIRGYSWQTIPISWRNRTNGESKLKLREMGSRYFFIIAYLWLEKYFSRGDYRKK